MTVSVEIFSQGEEVLSGQTVDTNAAWLAQELIQQGFTLVRHTVVGDQLLSLRALLYEISMRADCCICTGGLGPTSDDLTTQAVAEAFALDLVLDTESLAQIQQFYQQRQRPMAETNRKQAFFPQGAQRIDNPWGTAPGFVLQANRCCFVFLPGVPREMKNMFQHSVCAVLTQRFAVQAKPLITLRTVGIGESDLQLKLNAVSLPDAVQLSFRATVDDVQTKLLFPADFPHALMATLIQQCAESIGDYVFAIDAWPHAPQGSLVEVVAHAMQQQQLTLALYETASQGLIAAKCIAQPWLLEAVYQRNAEPLEGCSADDYFTQALEHAEQISQRLATDLVLVQLYQGTAENFSTKEQGITLYTLLLSKQGVQRSEFYLVGAAARKQNQAAIYALDLLRRYLQPNL